MASNSLSRRAPSPPLPARSAAKTLLFYFTELNPTLMQWLEYYMQQNPIPRVGGAAVLGSAMYCANQAGRYCSSMKSRALCRHGSAMRAATSMCCALSRPLRSTLPALPALLRCAGGQLGRRERRELSAQAAEHASGADAVGLLWWGPAPRAAASCPGRAVARLPHPCQRVVKECVCCILGWLAGCRP